MDNKAKENTTTEKKAKHARSKSTKGPIDIVQKQQEPAKDVIARSRMADYQMREDGLYYRKQSSTVWIPATCQAFEIVHSFHKGEGANIQTGITITFINKIGKPVELNFLDSDIQKKNSVRQRLAGAGMVLEAVDSYKYDPITDFLSHYIPDRHVEMVTQTGWFNRDGRHFFALPYSIIGDRDNSYLLQVDRPENIDYIKTEGSLKEWQAQIAEPARHSSRIVLAICTVLAGPLIPIIDAPNFAIHLVGQSRSGKSYTALLARSVLGYSQALPSWRATKNEIEKRAELNNGLCLIMDEIGQSDPVQLKEIDSVIYSLVNGVRKGRMNEREGVHWRETFLSTGEIGIREIHATNRQANRAGVENRLIQMPADAEKGLGVNETMPKNPNTVKEFEGLQELSMHYEEARVKYHGVAMEAWIKCLVNIVNDPPDIGAWDRFKKVINDEIAEFVKSATKDSDSEQVKQVARHFGLIQVAGLLASGGMNNLIDAELLGKVGVSDCDSITGWRPEEVREAITTCYKAWKEGYSTTGYDLELDEVIKRIRRTIGRREYPLKDQGFNQYGDTFGWIEDKVIEFQKTQTHIYFLPQRFDDEICNGANRKMILRMLKSIGYWKGNEKNRNTSETLRIGSRVIKVIHVMLPPIDERNM